MVTDYGAIRRIHLHSVRWRSTTDGDGNIAKWLRCARYDDNAAGNLSIRMIKIW